MTIARKAAWVAGALAPMLFALASTTPAITATKNLTLFSQITLPNKVTSFDIGVVDTVLGVYVLTDRTSGGSLDIIDTTTNPPSLRNQIFGFQGVKPADANGNNVSGPNGVIVVNHRTLWAGDGNGTLKVFSFGGALVTSIPLGISRVDELCFDPVHQVVMVTNDSEVGNGGPFSSFINARTYSVLHTSQYNGGVAAGPGLPTATAGAEQCQYNPRTGTFFMAIPECNVAGSNAGCVVEFNPTTFASTVYPVPHTDPATGCGKPQGMAIGPAPQILLGCSISPPGSGATAPTAVMDDGSTMGVKGSITLIPGAAGDDMVDFNISTGHYYLASSNNNNSPSNTAACNAGTAGPGLINVVTASTDTLLANPNSGNLANCAAGTTIGPHGGAHSIAADSAHNYVFVPIASTSGVSLCSTAPRSSGGTGVDTNGCIAVFTDP